ncbi:hypothetical protein [Maribacter sp. 1_2014MBL_MicDiv]|uniref:hypothetical protein n=1 Tax=Maribacter sp. 1_2014MBL_MicDiv TaxID=1644130 RepID=UPI0008F554F2|nr:hypothetical protein [Maribacter sp. 1_2014MBL_MicDiv]APA65653.1 hypothetical protein YQ22_15825 [Maribacter sp. 1_2014MBL_MicDiv]
MSTTVSVKRAFLDLLFIKSQLNRLLGDEPKYKDIISYMMTSTFLDSNEPLPSLKSMEQILNYKSHSLRKLIIDLYNEFFGEEIKNSLSFSKLDVYFDLSYFEGDKGYFKCNELCYIPRVGENITINFLKAKVGTDWFYVDKIRHDFYENTQIIEISLKSGIYNKYFHYEKYKAYEEGVINTYDLFNTHEVSIKRKMGLKRKELY